MKIAFSLDENDYLTHHLYIASTSERIKKQRLRSRVAGPLLYLAISVINFVLYEMVMAITFLILTPLWYVLYPLWERRRYERYYKNFVADTLKDRFGKMVNIEFISGFVLMTDSSSESKIANSEIEGIDEISNHYILRLKGGLTLPIPKDQISDKDGLRTKLQELANSLGVTYREDLGWRWK